MTKRSRTPLDDYLWPIFVAACGGLCVDCGKGEADDLQRGHIQRQDDDGPDTLDDLQPLCAECNGRDNKNFSMEDWRPADWRSQFIKFLAQALRTELRVAHPSQKTGVGCTILDDGKQIENTKVIPWENVRFAFNSVLSLPLSTLTHPYPLEQYKQVVEQAIRKGAEHADAPIPTPYEECRNKLYKLVQRHGRDDFLRATNEFLNQEKWFDYNNGFITRAMPQPWQNFADNFDIYLADAYVRAQRIAKAKADQRAAELAIDEMNKAEELKRRWNWLRRAGNTPDWPGMTDDDKAFIAKCRALPDEQQTVSDEDYQRARDIDSRYGAYWRGTKKYKLLEGIRHIRDRAFKDLYSPSSTIRSRRLRT